MKRMCQSALLIILLAILWGCAPSINRIGYEEATAPADTACVLKLTKFATFSADEAVVLGEFESGDSGLSTDCGKEDILEILHDDGCALGADVVNITEEKEPGFLSSCYRIKAQFLELATKDSSAFDLGTSSELYRGPWPKPKDERSRQLWAWTVHRLDLTSSSMENPYGNLDGTTISMIEWLPGRSGYRFGLVFRSGEGEAEILDPSWTFHERSLKTWMLSFEGSYLYRLAGTSRTASLTPFLGAGIGGTLGHERLRIDAERSPAATLEAELGALRASFQFHVLAAVQLKISSGFYGLLEGRWIQSGKGSTVAPDPDENDPNDVAARKLFDSLASRPDWSITGLQMRAGLALAF